MGLLRLGSLHRVRMSMILVLFVTASSIFAEQQLTLVHSFGNYNYNYTALLDSLRNAGFHHFLPLTHLTKLPVQISTELTVFVPSDTSIVGMLPRTLELLEYHVALQLLPYQNLTYLPLGYEIPTMLPGRSIVVTSSRGDSDLEQRLTIDDVEVIAPDLYRDGFIVVHGLNGVLNPFIYGGHTP